MARKNSVSTENKETFVVRVSKGKGESWYGDVSWVTGKSQQKFESAQELFSLINDSLDHSQNDANNV